MIALLMISYSSQNVQPFDANQLIFQQEVSNSSKYNSLNHNSLNNEPDRNLNDSSKNPIDNSNRTLISSKKDSIPSNNNSCDFVGDHSSYSTFSLDRIDETEKLNFSVFPVHYDLFFNLDTVNDSFIGRAVIICESVKNVDYVELHSENLEIVQHEIYHIEKDNLNDNPAVDSYKDNPGSIDGSFRNDNQKDPALVSSVNSKKEHVPESSKHINNQPLSIKKLDHTFSSSSNKVKLSFNSINPSFIEIHLLFKSKLSTNMTGFYISEYNGNKMYSTHFEATSARSCFPCFDLPSLKATFKVSLVHPKKLVALSNTPKIIEQNIEERFKELEMFLNKSNLENKDSLIEQSIQIIKKKQSFPEKDSNEKGVSVVSNNNVTNSIKIDNSTNDLKIDNSSNDLKIEGDKIDTNKIDTNKIDNNKIDNNKIDNDKIEGDKIGSDKIESDKIESDKIVEGAGIVDKKEKGCLNGATKEVVDSYCSKRYKHLGDVSCLLENSSILSDVNDKDDIVSNNNPVSATDGSLSFLKSYLNSDNVHLAFNSFDLSIASSSDIFSSFDNTPIMSSYLLAFVIGDLSYIEIITNYEPFIPIRVYTPVGEQDLGAFALQVAHESIKIFQQYFDIKYPLKKLDLVAVPEFAMGAMENWGLITFRKSSLLFDYNLSTISTKKLIAETVCHELAHQWFGNLVTMFYWNDLWLNEGFATWASLLCLNLMRKDLINYDVWTGFIVSDVEFGLVQDSLSSSHPIKVDVKNSSEIEQIFDAISYSKGASLIRMLEQFIGEDRFRNGLQRYLKKFMYRNASTDDLWECLGKNIKEMMDLWVSKVGYPIITVEELHGVKRPENEEKFHEASTVDLNVNETQNTVRNHNLANNSSNQTDSIDKSGCDFLVLSQERFTMLESKEKSSEWFVPISINFYHKKPKYEGDIEKDAFPNSDTNIIENSNNTEDNLHIFNEYTPDLTKIELLSKTVKTPLNTSLYKINTNNTGFYRVQYKNIENIMDLFKLNILNSKDKLNIINDYFQFAISTKIDYKTPLILIKYLKNETNCDVISSLLSGISEMKGIFYNQKDIKKIFSKIILDFIENKINKVDYRLGGRDINEIEVYTDIVDSAVGNNKKEVVDKLFAFYKDKEPIHPVFRRSMYISAIQKDNSENEKGNFDNNEQNNNSGKSSSVFYQLWDDYLNQNLDDIKVTILSALGSTKNNSQIQFLFDQIFKNDIKLQDKIYILNSLAGNNFTREKCIEFVMKNFEKIRNMYKKNEGLIGYVIERVFGVISDEKIRETVESFLNSLDKKEGIQRSIDKVIEKAKIRCNFYNKNIQELTTMIEK